jgi:hypothetical protein
LGPWFPPKKLRGDVAVSQVSTRPAGGGGSGRRPARGALGPLGRERWDLYWVMKIMSDLLGDLNSDYLGI